MRRTSADALLARASSIGGVPVGPVRKYHNEPVEIDGYLFASKREGEHYRQLRLREAAGEIHGLRVHPMWVFVVNGLRVGRYTADFSYCDGDGECHVIDVKGGRATRTEAYRLRRRLMLACHRIEVEEAG